MGQLESGQVRRSVILTSGQREQHGRRRAGRKTDSGAVCFLFLWSKLCVCVCYWRTCVSAVDVWTAGVTSCQRSEFCQRSVAAIPRVLCHNPARAETLIRRKVLLFPSVSSNAKCFSDVLKKWPWTSAWICGQELMSTFLSCKQLKKKNRILVCSSVPVWPQILCCFSWRRVSISISSCDFFFIDECKKRP